MSNNILNDSITLSFYISKSPKVYYDLQSTGELIVSKTLCGGIVVWGGE